MRKFLVLTAVTGLLACEAEKKENPTPPPSATILNNDNGIGGPNDPGNGDAVGEQPNPEPVETPPTGEETEEGVVLNVIAPEETPAKIKECIDQGVAGEVVNGQFTCNQQNLIVCNDLVEAQKKAALDYANANLVGYNLWGCSLGEDESPFLHYYMEEGVSLKVFNLAVKKQESPAP